MLAVVGIALVFVTPATGAADLVGTVRSRSISLVRPDGRLVKRLAPGTYSITIRDASAKANFHLVKPGVVDRKTGMRFTGTVRWRLALSKGVYYYRSDNHPSLMRSVVVG